MQEQIVDDGKKRMNTNLISLRLWERQGGPEDIENKRVVIALRKGVNFSHDSAFRRRKDVLTG